MKEETRKVVVLDWEDKIKLQQVINGLEQVADTYKNLLAELKNRLKISIFLWRKSCASR